MMKSQLNLRTLPWHLIVIFLLLATGIGTPGYFYYKDQKEDIKKAKTEELSAIADLKVGQIVSWRKERLGNATTVFRSPFVASGIHNWLKNPSDPTLRQGILNWMTSFRKTYDYESVILLDAKGNLRLSVSERKPLDCSHIQNQVAEALRTKKVILTDLHKSEPAGGIHLGIVIPILAPEGDRVRPISVLVLQVDPYQFLYPLIQSWPTPSQTSEILLVRREGDEVVYLNELRHRKDTALNLRFPLDKPQLPAAMVLQGKESVVEGLDYRGVPVVAAMRSIPESPWYLVAKVDKEEIDRPIHERAWMIAILSGLFIGFAGVTLGLIWRHQRAQFYRKLYEGELEREKLTQQLDFLTKHANDIIVLLDDERRIVDVNDRAVESYGYTRDELLQRRGGDLGPPEFRPIFDAQIKQVEEYNGFVYETFHQRKDGTTFPVEVSSRPIWVGEKKFYQSIIRNITERKKMEEVLRDSQAELSAIIENAPMVMLLVDRERRVRKANSAAIKFAGHPAEEMMGLRSGEALRCLHSLDDSRGCGFGQFCETCTVRITVIDTLEKGRSHYGVEARLSFDLRGKVEEKYFLLSTVPLTISKDQLVLVYIEDITERKRAEQALRESEERFRELFNGAPIGYHEIDSEGKINRANRTELEMLEYTEEEILGRYVWEFIVEQESQQKVKEKLTGIIPAGHAFERTYRRKDGMPIPVLIEDRLIKNSEGRIIGMRSTLQNISERKHIEEALRSSEEKYRTILENIEDGYYEVDIAGNLTFFNNSFCRIYGYSREELMGMNDRQYTDQENAKKLFQAFNKVYRTGESTRGFNWQIIRKDGTKRYIEASVSLIKNISGQPLGFRGIVRDITERKRAEEALCQAEERYRSIFENAVEGIFQSTPEGRYISANPAHARILGYESPEDLITSITDIAQQVFVESERRQEFNRLLEEHGVVKGFGFQASRKDGSKIWISSNVRAIRDATGGVIYYEGTAEDMTERKSAEEEKATLQEQLRQSQKIEAIGRLAGGIAHDFNNLLTVIKGYSQLSLIEIKEGDPLSGNIEEIKKAADRAADLTHQLLAFSRRQIMEMKVLDLNDLLKNLNKMLRRVIGEDIELVTLLAEDLERVKTDPGQIEQVIMNLAVNARDAMPEGGKLTIETANVDLDDAYARKHVAVTPGRFVMISVSDTGVGMPLEVRDRVFEPFFTTKEKGKGTGLGLSTVYGIVKQSGGNIWVYSEPGQCTTFKIYLPRVDEPLEELGERVEVKEIPRGMETILVVEDEGDVRKLAVRILERQGYKVLEASQGLSAFLIAEEYEDFIHLLVTDVVMPKMSGRELADRIAEIRPEIKVLYMSGYTDNAIVHHGVLGEGMKFIQKPFTVDGLARKVREVLDKDSNPDL